MSVYIFQRLLTEGSLPAPILLEALELGERANASFVEALVSADVRHAYTIARCFVKDGEKADKSWRPDPRLLLDLPPGLCERFLAFPFRERAGAVEVATVTPLDKGVHEEFTFHLRRPIALFRANLQALLAAAGAPVDLGVLAHSLSEPPPQTETSPIPLIKRSSKNPKPRPRTRTSPGLGEESSSSMPPAYPDASDFRHSSPRGSQGGAPGELVDHAQDERELARALSRLLTAPFLILEIGDDELIPRVASSKRDGLGEVIPRWEECLFNVAADEGKYIGPWLPGPIHQRFSHLFNDGDLVRAERVGSLDRGLVVVQKVAFDGSDDGEVLDRARAAWGGIQKRVAVFGSR